MQIRMMTAEVEEIVKSLLRIAPPHKTFAPPVFLFFYKVFLSNEDITCKQYRLQRNFKFNKLLDIK